MIHDLMRRQVFRSGRIMATIRVFFHSAYYNALLLSLPSFPCFSQDLEDFREKMRFAWLDSTIQYAWDDFATALLNTWNRSGRDCVWLML
ncbi:uncharacterized protein PHACADRAFT_259821 [Phanerochaete carnosa HHB-10118-sp]|uniref:Uncharacterized protein n=1 Tax=Phanerochaete carnosa (strain HHB-10118-sp) TaxID=650164 RepID=K5VPR1_PHACS|nr:uncharacterized protein PHACADRAFT_259821 [Phanerochaete carnosa HHB-10118-sp]EKM53438.1 hypothetical protein PHACADRAFT_259821 [Phanerochaete carnosa HHB-10118-sp]